MYVRTHVRVSVGDMGVSGIRTYVRTYARAFAQDVLVGTCVYTHKRTAQVLVRVRANVRTVCIVRKCACEGGGKEGGPVHVRTVHTYIRTYVRTYVHRTVRTYVGTKY